MGYVLHIDQGKTVFRFAPKEKMKYTLSMGGAEDIASIGHMSP